MPLDMRNASVFARYDLAYAMRQQGFPVSVIMRECKYSSTGNVYRAIRNGAERAKLNEGRVSQRMFGVEIEFNRTSQADALFGVQQLDDTVQILIEGYNHRVQDHWKIITDASVSGTGTGGQRQPCRNCRPLDGNEHEGCSCYCHRPQNGPGLEVVSPILQGANGFRQLESVVKGIRSQGGGVDRSCGLHVHHDARDMSPAAVARLLKFYMDNQTTIDGLLAPSRRTCNYNQWCRPWDSYEKDEVVQRAINGSHLGGYDRYKTINVTSYPKYGSIEFRQHQGTLNFNKIANWVRFGQAVVEAAIATTDEDHETFSDVASMLNYLVTKGGLPKSSADYLLDRANSYANR